MTASSTLRQISAMHDPEQDRILLRINSSDGAEMRFWITRRYLLLLRQTLGNMAGRLSATHAGAAVPAATPGSYSDYSREQAVKDGEFRTGYQPGTVLPLGKTPVLLNRLSARAAPAGSNLILSLHPAQGQGIDLNMDENLVHAFTQVIEAAAQKADWGIVRNQPSPQAPAEGCPHLLH